MEFTISAGPGIDAIFRPGRLKQEMSVEFVENGIVVGSSPLHRHARLPQADVTIEIYSAHRGRGLGTKFASALREAFSRLNFDWTPDTVEPDDPGFLIAAGLWVFGSSLSSQPDSGVFLFDANHLLTCDSSHVWEVGWSPCKTVPEFLQSFGRELAATPTTCT